MRSHEHERLFVYQRALDVVRVAEPIATALSHHRPDLCDQLRRAASSVPLNIAEGAGEFRKAEKVRSYRMTRRSGGECFAILDVATIVAPGIETRACRSTLDEVIGLLTLLIRSVEERSRARSLRR